MAVIRKYWFIGGIVLGALLGFCVPAVAAAIRQAGLTGPLVFGVFLLSGLKLPAKEFLHAVRDLRRWLPGLIFMLAGTPLVFWGLAAALFRNFPEAAVGLILAGLLPTTVTSSLIIADEGGGDKATALCLNIFSNIFGVLILGPAFAVLVRAGAAVEFAPGLLAPWRLLGNLALTVILPFVIGQTVSALKPNRFGKFSRIFSVYNKLVVILMVIGSVGGARPKLLEHRSSILAIFGACLAAHLTIMALAAGLARILKYDPDTRWSLIICSSQKTLMIGYYVWELQLAALFPAAAVPIVVYHPMQLILDGLLSGRRSNRSGASS